MLRQRLDSAGVGGADDLGRFVSDTTDFEPSLFDEKAAFDVLIAALPDLNDAKLVGAVAGHLRRPWARGKAFTPLANAFGRWAPEDSITGWHLGDALGRAATTGDLADLLDLAARSEFGQARQMIVLALGRFKTSPEARRLSHELAEDDDVALHALQAYRRIAGPKAALTRSREVVASRPGTRASEQAEREACKLAGAIKD